MTYYLKPPRGEIHLERVVDLCFGRCRFLKMLDQFIGDDFKDVDRFHELLAQCPDLMESVAERTPKDRISHFMTMLAVCRDYDLSTHFIRLETEFFRYRLENLHNDHLKDALVEVHRHLCEKIAVSGCDRLKTLKKSVKKVLDSKMLTHPCLPEDEFDGDCCCKFLVPFDIVPELVAKRRVDLYLGQATISCRNARSFLTSVFHSVLSDSVRYCSRLTENNDYGRNDEDNRMTSLLRQIRFHFKSTIMNGRQFDPNGLSFTAAEVPKISNHFPLCFLRVQRHLQCHKRLEHHARVAYTLFLKEIGLTLNESISFWSTFYSKAPTGNCSCKHSWQDSGRKFSYSISHLYGKAGGFKNYSAHSCQSIMTRSSSATEQLVCPFAVRSDDLEDLLREHLQVEEKVSTVLNLSYDPERRCSAFLALKCQKDLNQSSLSISKPSQFFKLCHEASN